jgi:hypothetical protein
MFDSKEDCYRSELGLGSIVASFFLAQHTQIGENIPNSHKIYQMGIKLY